MSTELVLVITLIVAIAALLIDASNILFDYDRKRYRQRRYRQDKRRSRK